MQGKLPLDQKTQLTGRGTEPAWAPTFVGQEDMAKQPFTPFCNFNPFCKITVPGANMPGLLIFTSLRNTCILIGLACGVLALCWAAVFLRTYLIAVGETVTSITEYITYMATALSYFSVCLLSCEVWGWLTPVATTVYSFLCPAAPAAIAAPAMVSMGTATNGGIVAIAFTSMLSFIAYLRGSP